MDKTWRCGDCGTWWPDSRRSCGRVFDDYLAIRGGSVESAMEFALYPYLERLAVLERRLRTPRCFVVAVQVSTFGIAA